MSCELGRRAADRDRPSGARRSSASFSFHRLAAAAAELVGRGCGSRAGREQAVPKTLLSKPRVPLLGDRRHNRATAAMRWLGALCDAAHLPAL